MLKGAVAALSKSVLLVQCRRSRCFRRSRQELNGRLGEVLSYDSASGRYAVTVLPRREEEEGAPMQCKVHERNLRPAAAF